MRASTRVRGLIALGALLTSAVTMSGRAATPSAGTVDPTNTTVTWTGTFETGGINAAGACWGPASAAGALNGTAPTACDMFALDVTVGDGFWDGKTGSVTVTLDGFGDADVDLWIYERTETGGFGSSVGSSTNPAGDAESFGIAKAAGAYWVAAIGFDAAAGTTYTGSAVLTSSPLPDPGPFTDVGPQVVVALVDTGVNPYHKAFRDTSEIALRHPATYIPGYPADAKPLNLHLDAPDMATALQLDADVWANVKRGVLYYVPGTRIAGFISMGAGGTRCGSPDFFPVNTVNSVLSCTERILLDDHGHGTMTASRAAAAMPGNERSLGSSARIVEIEGLGGGSVRWAADQGWIDVSSNSWSNLVPYPATALIDDTYADVAYSTTRTLTVFATGNGIGGALGFAPNSTHLLATAPAGVVLVGAHDNGKVSFWSGSPPHVIADGYGGWMAAHDSMDRYEPDSVACCTSAAAPYAAGGAARVILAARQLLGSSDVGVHDGVLASGPALASGPLSDGVFTLDEARSLLFHTAESPARSDRDDGLLQWMGDPRAPDHIERGPGANPYCNGCQTLPIGWTEVPPEIPAYVFAGYGAINLRSTNLALAVLAGTETEPSRADVDAFYAQDQALREQLADV